MDKEVLVGGNRREDVRWLLSLSESELELLISLKKLVMQRAETIGHEALANKFNLEMLRVLGFIIMQYVKKQVKDLSVSGLSESAVLLNASNLLNCESMDGIDWTDHADLEIDMLMENRKCKIPRKEEFPPADQLRVPVQRDRKLQPVKFLKVLKLEEDSKDGPAGLSTVYTPKEFRTECSKSSCKKEGLALFSHGTE